MSNEYAVGDKVRFVACYDRAEGIVKDVTVKGQKLILVRAPGMDRPERWFYPGEIEPR